MRFGCAGTLAKICFYGLAAIVVINVVWILVSPLLPEREASKPATAPKRLGGTGAAPDASPENPPPGELAHSDMTTQEQARTWQDELGRVYARGFERTTIDGRNCLIATLEVIPARKPEIHWFGISKAHSRIEVGSVALNPVMVEGAADLDEEFAVWVRDGLSSYAVPKRLDEMPAAERKVAGQPYAVRLRFWLPEGFSVPTSEEWARIHLVMMSNLSMGYKNAWRVEPPLTNYPHFAFDVYAPPKSS